MSNHLSRFLARTNLSSLALCIRRAGVSNSYVAFVTQKEPDALDPVFTATETS